MAKVTCKACRYSWAPRKARYAPRRRCPACFRLMVHPHKARLAPEYISWQSMKQRCRDATARDFKHYGGRGIRVCDRWRVSFAAFLKDMGPRPAPGYSLDRINADGNYEPGNCRWATKSQQMRNRRPWARTKRELTAAAGSR